MAVDYVAVLAGDAEGVEHAVAHGLVVAEGVVGTLFLDVGLLVGYEVAFECRHARLVEQWRLRPAPEVPEIVGREVLLRRRGVVVEGRAHRHAYVVEKFAPRVEGSSKLHLAECAVGVERHRGVEEEVGVDDGVHASVGEEAADVAAQLVAHQERVA